MIVAPTNWTASALRTIVWPQYAGGGTRFSLPAMLPAIWPSKNAGDQLDFALDLDAWLADEGDQLVGIDAAVAAADGSVEPTDLAVVWSTILGGRPTVMLSAGRPGIAYLVTLTLSTLQGRRVQVPVRLAVTTLTASLAPLPAPVAQSCLLGLTTPSGAVLTTDNDLALTVNLPVVTAATAGAPNGSVPPNVIGLGGDAILTIDTTPLLYA